MKIKNILALLSILSISFLASPARADLITATNSGNWGDTNVWDSQTVPGTNDDVLIVTGVNVIVDTNASASTIADNSLNDPVGGTVTMAPYATLNIFGNFGTDGLKLLNATAKGNTVNYFNNPFFAKECDYFNLVFCNTNYATTNMSYQSGYQNFNNFSRHGPTPMTIAGDMTILGNSRVQQGADIFIAGNLTIGQYCGWDSSVANLTVMSNTVMGGFLFDGNSALGTNGFNGDLIVTSTSFLWYISDVTTWFLNGNLTNNGTLLGTGYGSIIFNGPNNFITGSKPILIPTMTVNGTYAINDTITLFTNTPTLNGTLVFDIANAKQIILLTNAGTALYYSGNLNVINSGPAPAAGATYKFFNSTNGFGGSFASTGFPGLPGGLSWVDNTLTSGSIAVVGAVVGSPTLSLSRSGGVLTLAWDSTTFPGYSLQSQTNSAGIHSNWSATGSGTTSPFTVAINPTNPPVFFRLSNP
jgi:hypothetical protein